MSLLCADAAVVNVRVLCVDVNIGWPGMVHDARVFANLSLYLKGSNGTVPPYWTLSISGVDVPQLLQGDQLYFLKLWLMKPYLENASITAQERNYN